MISSGSTALLDACGAVLFVAPTAGMQFVGTSL
jgi:hypothetical protein